MSPNLVTDTDPIKAEPTQHHWQAKDDMTKGIFITVLWVLDEICTIHDMGNGNDDGDVALPK